MHDKSYLTSRPGAVMLEVIVAMTIFAIASTTTLIRAVEARHVVALAQASENRLDSASAFLDHVALWSARDFERHLGTHPQGPWFLGIEHPAPVLYTIALMDGKSHDKLLDTVVYRADAPSSPAY